MIMYDHSSSKIIEIVVDVMIFKIRGWYKFDTFLESASFMDRQLMIREIGNESSQKFTEVFLI